MTKIPNGHEVIQLFEAFSPKSFALEGDKIGLQIGKLNRPVKNIMVALDVLEDVIDEAIENKVDLIIAHHPPIYRPLKNVITDQPSGRIVEKCMKNDIAIYAAHTNLDVAKGGVNDLLAAALQLQNTEVLIPTYEIPLKKLVVFVPEEAAEQVRIALGMAGAGHIGNYSHCAYTSQGVGTFLPHEGANPYIGRIGDLTQVNEIRIESIFPASIQKKVISEMLKAHPYEEVAFDIYPLDNKGETMGLGKIGTLVEELSLKDFAEFVKKVLDVKTVRVVGNVNDRVKKVAVLGGDGNKYINDAKFRGADVYVTGDIYYHVAHDAMMMGLNIVDPGHNVEKVMKKGVTELLKKEFTRHHFDVNIFPSRIHTDPFMFI
jgi:dinuclear metal center YbgI/SA1388 family protein